MKKKKWVIYCFLSVLAIILSVGCSANENANRDDNNNNTEPTEGFNEKDFPIVDEQITLSMFGERSPVNGPFDEMPPFIAYEEMTNIKIDWENVPVEGYDEQKNLLFGSSDLPDAFYKARLTHNDVLENGYNGVLISLEGLIDEYAPNLKAIFEEYPDVEASVTAPDGHIYAVPSVVTAPSARTEKHWINTEWLEALDLRVPETMDELVNVLEAFRDDDPNGNGEQDEIPMTARNPNQLIHKIAGSFGLQEQMGYFLEINDDEVNVWVTGERYKDMLMFLNKLYAEGLLDNEIFSHTPSEYISKMGSGKAGFFYDQTNGPFKGIKDTYTGITPPEGPNGDRIVDTFPISRDFGAFAITSENKHPEATIRWIDHFYGEEGSILLRYGVEDEHHIRTDDGELEHADEFKESPAQWFPYGGGGAPHWINDENSYEINPPKVQEAQEQLDPYLQEVRYAPPLFDVDTAKEVDTLRADIDTYINESRDKFISGDQSFDDWDKYVSQLETMGIDRLEEIFQEVYDSTYRE